MAYTYLIVNPTDTTAALSQAIGTAVDVPPHSPRQMTVQDSCSNATVLYAIGYGCAVIAADAETQEAGQLLASLAHVVASAGADRFAQAGI